MKKKKPDKAASYEELDNLFTADVEPYEWLERHGFRPMYPSRGGLVETYVYEIMDDFDQGPHRVGVVYVAPPSDRPFFSKQPKGKWMAELRQTLMVTPDDVQMLSEPYDDPRECLVGLVSDIRMLKTRIRAATGGVLPELTTTPFGF